MQAAKAIMGRYIRRSAARSAAGKIDELGKSKIKPAMNQKPSFARPNRKDARQTRAINAAHASRPSHSGATRTSGSGVNPQGNRNMRR